MEIGPDNDCPNRRTSTVNRIYHLTGNTSELKDYIGHELEITGKSSGSSAASAASASEAGGSQQAMLDVKSMKHIAMTCKSAAK